MIDFDVVTGPNPSEQQLEKGRERGKSNNAARKEDRDAVSPDAPRPKRAPPGGAPTDLTQVKTQARSAR